MLLLLAACSENELNKIDDPVPDTAGEGAPDIAVTPGAVAFDAIDVGASASATVTISNAGDAALHLSDIRLEAGGWDLSFTAVSSPIVPPGSSVDTVVTWTPSAGGPLDDALWIESDDPDTARVTVPITGIAPYGEILVEPAFYDFGTLEVGMGATTTVTVSNIGDGPLTIDDWSYTATDADMQVVDPGALASLPAVLAPGEATTLLVAYTPSGAGGDEGSLSIDSDDPDTPNTGAQQQGNAEDPDPCDGYLQSVELFITADDAWQGWIDGVSFSAPNQNSWSAFDTLDWELACGDHTLALYATDTAQAVSGVIAVIKVEGTVRFVSGPTDWSMLDSTPPAGWQDVGFDDSGWHTPEVCANTSLWGSAPQPFYDLGAQWIWWTSNCTDLGEAWLRLDFTVVP
jgi:hypothetical protein